MPDDVAFDAEERAALLLLPIAAEVIGRVNLTASIPSGLPAFVEAMRAEHDDPNLRIPDA